jgi:hypothetical protein
LIEAGEGESVEGIGVSDLDEMDQTNDERGDEDERAVRARRTEKARMKAER